MAMKCSERRVILQRVVNLVSELQQANEAVARYTRDAELTDLVDVDVKANAILDGVGLATTTDGIGDTISDVIVGILYGNIADDVQGVLDWAYESE